MTDTKPRCKRCTEPCTTPVCTPCLATLQSMSAWDIEYWLAVVGHEGRYDVSNLGRVRSLERLVRTRDKTGKWTMRRVPGQMLKPWRASNRGKKWVRPLLVSIGRDRKTPVHVVVLTAFIGPRPPDMECCHWNDINTDNRLVNVRWDTSSANHHDQVRNGRHHGAKKTHCKRGHEFTPENTGIHRKRGGGVQRYCLTCSRDHGRENMRRYRRERKRSAQLDRPFI